MNKEQKTRQIEEVERLNLQES